MTTSANPEVAFWLSVQEARDGELEELRKKNGGIPVIIFTGGSSCAFSVRPTIVEKETGLPAINLGLAAGSGSKFIIEQARLKCRPGDILVMALEPHFLVQEGRGRPTQLGISLATVGGDPSMAAGGESFGDRVSLAEFSNFMRPGPRYTATWGGKAIRGDLGYRYKIGDLRAGGWLESAYRPPEVDRLKVMQSRKLSNEGKQLLQNFLSRAAKDRIKVYYSLPWILVDPSIEEQMKANSRSLIAEVSKILPVLKDPNFGIQTNAGFFADSSYHLNREGGTIRSRIIGRSLIPYLSSR